MPSIKESAQQSRRAQVRTSRAVTLWLILTVGVNALYYTSSGEELLLISTEGAWNAARLWIGQALLAVSLFAYLSWVRGDTGIAGFRLVAAGLAAVPMLLLSNAFLIAATRFTAAEVRLNLQDEAFIYSLSATVGAFVLWRFFALPMPPKRGVIFSFLALSCLLLCCAVFPAAVGILFGPNLIISVAACVVLALSAIIQHARNRVAVGRSFSRALDRVLLAFAGPLLAIWFLIGLSQNTHVVRTFPSDDPWLHEYANWRLSVDHSLELWYAQHKGEGAVVPMFLVESAGGGLRAAYWTTSVLTALDAIEGFRDHLFVISSVSGGSLGATVYRAAITARDEKPAPGPLRLESMRKFYTHDFLGPLTAGWLFSDSVSNLVPWNVFPDRAEALERGWEHAWWDDWHNNLFGEEFRHLWPQSQGPIDPAHPLPPSRWPHLVLNGASLVNGNVLVTSDLRQLANAAEAFPRVAEIVPLRYPTSTAINNSARFPFLAPPGMIVIEKRVVQAALNQLGPGFVAPDDAVQDLIVDGGYVDNYGAYALADLLDHVREFNCELARRAQLKPNEILDTTGCGSFERAPDAPGIAPVVIQITSDPDLIRSPMAACGCFDPPNAWRIEPSGERTRKDITPFTEALAPAIVLDQMRQRNGVLFSEALASRPDISAYFHFGISPLYPTDGQLRREEPVPSLNWALSQRSMRQIDDYLSQCEHLQTQELQKLLREPEKAAQNTRLRIERTTARAARMTREQMGPICH